MNITPVFSLLWSKYEGTTTTMYFISFNENLYMFDVDKRSGYVRVTAFDGRYRLYHSLVEALNSLGGKSFKAYYTSVSKDGVVKALIPLKESGAVVSDITVTFNSNNKAKQDVPECIDVNEIIKGFKVWFVGLVGDEAYFLRVVDNKVVCYKESKSKALENRAGKYYNIVGQGNEIVLRNKQARVYIEDNQVYMPLFTANLAKAVEKAVNHTTEKSKTGVQNNKVADNKGKKEVTAKTTNVANKTSKEVAEKNKNVMVSGKLVNIGKVKGPFKIPMYRSKFMSDIEDKKFSDDFAMETFKKSYPASKYFFLKYYGQFGKYAGVINHIDSLLLDLVDPITVYEEYTGYSKPEKHAAKVIAQRYMGATDPFRCCSCFNPNFAAYIHKFSRKDVISTFMRKYGMTPNIRTLGGMYYIFGAELIDGLFKTPFDETYLEIPALNYIMQLSKQEYEFIKEMHDYCMRIPYDFMKSTASIEAHYRMTMCLNLCLRGRTSNHPTLRDYYVNVFLPRDDWEIIRDGKPYSIIDYKATFGKDTKGAVFYNKTKGIYYDLISEEEFVQFFRKVVKVTKRNVFNYDVANIDSWLNYYSHVTSDIVKYCNSIPSISVLYFNSHKSVNLSGSKMGTTYLLSILSTLYTITHTTSDRMSYRGKMQDDVFRYIKGVLLTCAKHKGYSKLQLEKLIKEIDIIQDKADRTCDADGCFKYLFTTVLYIRFMTYDANCEVVRTSIMSDIDEAYASNMLVLRKAYSKMAENKVDLKSPTVSNLLSDIINSMKS